MARHDMTDAATVEMDSDRGQVMGTVCSFCFAEKIGGSSSTPTRLEVVQH
jgi:hypothetical protein